MIVPLVPLALAMTASSFAQPPRKRKKAFVEVKGRSTSLRKVERFNVGTVETSSHCPAARFEEYSSLKSEEGTIQEMRTFVSTKSIFKTGGDATRDIQMLPVPIGAVLLLTGVAAMRRFPSAEHATLTQACASMLLEVQLNPASCDVYTGPTKLPLLKEPTTIRLLPDADEAIQFQVYPGTESDTQLTPKSGEVKILCKLLKSEIAMSCPFADEATAEESRRGL
jgi:hypothetical protein